MHPRQSQMAMFRWQITVCLSFLKRKSFCGDTFLWHAWDIQFYLPFFHTFSVTISVPVCVWKVCMFRKDTFSWGTKFGGEHFPETPYMPFLFRRRVSCQPHRRWIKSIGLLFLLHNPGSISVLTDPQLINGQDRLLWSWWLVNYQVSCIEVQTGNTCWSDFNWKRKILWKMREVGSWPWNAEGFRPMRKSRQVCYNALNFLQNFRKTSHSLPVRPKISFSWNLLSWN